MQRKKCAAWIFIRIYPVTDRAYRTNCKFDKMKLTRHLGGKSTTITNLLLTGIFLSVIPGKSLACRISLKASSWLQIYMTYSIRIILILLHFDQMETFGSSGFSKWKQNAAFCFKYFGEYNNPIAYFANSNFLKTKSRTIPCPTFIFW
jgi:hypothetical protein